MSGPEMQKSCDEIAPLLVFFACGEVSEQEHAAIQPAGLEGRAGDVPHPHPVS